MRVFTLDTTLIISFPIYFLIARALRFMPSGTCNPSSLYTSSVWYGMSIWKDLFFDSHRTSFESRWDTSWRVKLLDSEVPTNIYQIWHYSESFSQWRHENRPRPQKKM